MSPAPGVGHLHTAHIQQYMLCILLIKQVSHYLQLSQGTYQGNSRGLVGDYPKISAPGVRLLQPLCDKSPPFPGWGGVGLCIDRCIRQLENDLINVLQHEIDVVLTKAWSVDIIGEQVRSLAQASSYSCRVKAEKFVHVIRDRIKTDPGAFDTFLRILRSTPSLGHLADGLEEKLCPEHRIPIDSNKVADLGGVPRPSMTSTPRSSISNNSQPRHRDPTASNVSANGVLTSAEYHTRTPPRGRKKRHGSSSDSPAHSLSGGQPKLDLAEDNTDEESGYTSVPVNEDSRNDESENVDGEEQPGSNQHNSQLSFNAPVEAESDYKPFSKITGNESEIEAKSQSAEPNNDLAAGGVIGQEIHHDATSQQQVVGSGVQPTPEGWAAKATFFVNQGAAKEAEMAREIEELKKEISSLNQKVEASNDENQKVEEMQDQMHEQEEELARYKTKLAEKERELLFLQKKWREEIQAAEDQLQQERVDHSCEIERVEEEMKLLQTQLQEKSTEAEKLRHEYDDLKKTSEATIKDLEEKLKAKTMEASKLKDEYHQLEEKRKKEIAQLDKTYKKQISELEELVQSQKEQARLKEENLQIKLEKEYMEKEIQRLKDESELRLKIKDLEKELALKETQVEQVKKEEQARKCQEMDAQMKQQAKQHEKEKAKMREEMKMEREQSERKLQEIFHRLSSVSSTSSSEMSLSRSNTGPSYNGADKDAAGNGGTSVDKDNVTTITEDLKGVHLSISNSDKED